jgi:hypothetical protein
MDLILYAIHNVEAHVINITELQCNLHKKEFVQKLSLFVHT